MRMKLGEKKQQGAQVQKRRGKQDVGCLNKSSPNHTRKQAACQ